MWEITPVHDRHMRHIEKRANLYYAVLTVPPDVRHLIGKMRFVKSLQTDKKTEAQLRAAMLVAGWKGEIERARGSMPNPKDAFWQAMRKDFLAAKDEAHEFAVQDLIEQAASKVTDPEEASRLYRTATGQAPERIPLGPLVTAWKDSRGNLVKKTVDQGFRDVSRMANHFQHLDKLTHATAAQKVKAWTDDLLAEGATAATIDRLGKGCRAFWSYLQQSGKVTVLEACPFDGPFKLALKNAKRNKIDRTGFTPQEVADLYAAALAKGDQPLADLIALGAYSGGRIEELCKLTKETSKDGYFRMGTKTDASLRDCPIHPTVAPLVASLVKASKDGYLIPSAADNQYGNRSGPLSQRFGHLKRDLGFGPSHVFHSLRHTLVTLMHQAGVPSPVISDVVGHEKGVFTLDKYGSGSSMAQKLEAISKVAYPGALATPTAV